MRHPPSRSDQPVADMGMGIVDIAGRRRQPGADRPHRFVGNDGVCGGRRRRTIEQVDLARQHVKRWPALRSPASRRCR